MLLQTAIKDRIDTIHPFSAHMNGGLDSTPLSIISGRILKEKNIPFYTFNWCKPRVEDENLHNHEWSDARDIAKAEIFTHYEI
ncbi:MAG: hypothetical protein U5K55_01205 [Aliarcobacter sp.]|nr:hypothetical protein [Aliarcobacter sp.]